MPATATDAPTATPGESNGPGPSGEPDGPPSSQSLIAADLEAGTISQAQSLLYRAWALFWDPRLPERYDGAGSAGEDNGLFRGIAAVLPTLPADQAAELEPFLLRPTDPRSAFSAGATAATGAWLAASTSAPHRCTLPATWWPEDWSSDRTVDHGFRIWACAERKDQVQDDLDRVVDVAQALWPSMTEAVPAGMGLPASDLGAAQPDGNGKVDVYLVDRLATCRERGTVCTPIPGDAGAATTTDTPEHCGKDGSKPKGCSAYMVLNRQALFNADFAATFAHEFFHVLQDAHNGQLEENWYEEASATWAEWEYVANAAPGVLLSGTDRKGARDEVYDLYHNYQVHRKSLLKYLPDLTDTAAYQYEAWGWPLFQAVERGPASIFNTYVLLEDADLREEVDEAVDAQLPFADGFRDFAVRNAQPSLLVDQSSDDMPADRWRTKPKLGDFPEDQHLPNTTYALLPKGVSQHPVAIDALNAHYEPIEVADPAIRSIKIDISGLTGHDLADLDVIGLVSGGAASSVDTWRRFRGAGGVLTLCRDNREQNVRYMEIVISNHSIKRVGNDPDPAAQVKGDYKIETADKCVAPDHFSGTIAGHNNIDSWTGTVTFDRVLPGDPQYDCNETNEQVTYCYKVVGGQVTWTADGGTATPGVGPPLGTGSLELIVSDSRRPELAGSYEILVAPVPEKVILNGTHGPREASSTVFAWTQVIDYPKWPSDWHLSGTEDHSGCGLDGCGTQIWSWDLTASFDP